MQDQVSQQFEVNVSRVKGPGYGGMGYHLGTLLIEPTAVKIDSTDSVSTEAAVAGGALAGGVVGAAVAGVVGKAMSGPGSSSADPAKHRAHYDAANQLFMLELANGDWIEVVPIAKKSAFDDVLAVLQSVYGSNLTAMALGRISPARKLFLVVMMGFFCLTPGIGVLFGPVVMATLLAMIGVLLRKGRRIEGFLIAMTVLAAVGATLNLFVYPLETGGRPILPWFWNGNS